MDLSIDKLFLLKI